MDCDFCVSVVSKLEQRATRLTPHSYCFAVAHLSPLERALLDFGFGKVINASGPGDASAQGGEVAGAIQRKLAELGSDS
eukprot:6652324-Alexandrium_andersonii.AAC.1